MANHTPSASARGVIRFVTVVLAPGLCSCRFGFFLEFAGKVQEPFARLEVKRCPGEPIAALCVPQQIVGDFAQQI